jgi:hypothetical protein
LCRGRRATERSARRLLLAEVSKVDALPPVLRVPPCVLDGTPRVHASLGQETERSP